MAMKGLSIAVGQATANVRPSSDATAANTAVGAAIDDLQANSLGNLTTAMAAAQVIGAGDASVPIDAADLALIELTAAIAAAEALNVSAGTAVSGDVIVQVTTTVTRAQLQRALDAAYRHFTQSSGIITG